MDRGAAHTLPDADGPAPAPAFSQVLRPLGLGPVLGTDDGIEWRQPPFCRAARPADAANKSYAASGTIPYAASSAEAMAAMAKGLTIPPPGLGPINRWFPDQHTEPGPGSEQWGYVAYKTA